MPVSKPRKSLNKQQIEILKILYKFRFATVSLIAGYQQLDSKVYSYKRLRSLEEKNYISRHYDSSYRIHGQEAIYYILTKGIRTLRSNPELSAKALNGMYRDGLAKQPFMTSCLTIFRLFLKFSQLYGQNLSFYTKAEITDSHFFPSPLPDAYLRLQTTPKTTTDYMLEIIDTSMSYALTNHKLTRYFKHSKTEASRNPNSSYPGLLFICATSLLERRVQRIATRLLNQAAADQLKIYTTTIQLFMDSAADQPVVWKNALEPKPFTGLA